MYRAAYGAYNHSNYFLCSLFRKDSCDGRKLDKGSDQPIRDFMLCAGDENQTNITERCFQITGGAGGKDACEGDSGGPLVVKVSVFDLNSRLFNTKQYNGLGARPLYHLRTRKIGRGLRGLLALALDVAECEFFKLCLIFKLKQI